MRTGLPLTLWMDRDRNVPHLGHESAVVNSKNLDPQVVNITYLQLRDKSACCKAASSPCGLDPLRQYDADCEVDCKSQATDD